MSWKRDPVTWTLIILEFFVLAAGTAFWFWGVGGSFLALGLFLMLAVITRPVRRRGDSDP